MSEEKPKFAAGGIIRSSEFRAMRGEEVVALPVAEKFAAYEQCIAELEGQVKELKQERARALGKVSRFRAALEEIAGEASEGGWVTAVVFIAREALNGE